MMVALRLKFCSTILFLALFSCHFTSGSGYIPILDRHLVKEAELIFEGVVTDKVYKESSVENEEHQRLPHTFITFQIENILKGNTANPNEITLRFGGGLTNEKDGFVYIDIVPLFDVGERYILGSSQESVH